MEILKYRKNTYSYYINTEFYNIDARSTKSGTFLWTETTQKVTFAPLIFINIKFISPRGQAPMLLAFVNPYSVKS